VGGGCISAAYRVRLADGRAIFVKAAPPNAPADLFEQEARALRVLDGAGAVRVPRVLAVAEEWLALEWLEPGGGGASGWRQLGAGLAALHRSRAPEYGWPADNYIGPLPQFNQATTSWAEFWAERRLRPQLQRARHRLGAARAAAVERLLAVLPERLDPAAADGASLLHGDLWTGNVHMTADGPALIDPASYHGHREVDLAMAALFGPFPAAFMEAYTAAWPLLPHAERRLPVYQLYYLLVHVNLFGDAYLAGTDRALRAALG
jgi:fructosamine-3-kinase